MKIRLSAHQLKIESGRYSRNRVERTQRYCTLSSKKDIEYEYHFILICPIYVNIRKKYIDVIYYNRPNMYKFCQLLQKTDKNSLIICQNIFMNHSF